VNYKFLDDVSSLLSSKYYKHIDTILLAFINISQLTEYEFRLQYEKEQTIEVKIDGDSTLTFKFKFSSNIIYVYELID